MSVKPIPDGYHSVNLYLVVADAARLIDFVTQAFGAVELFRHNRPDGQIGHAEVKIGDTIVMVGGASADDARPTTIYLYVADTDATYAKALAAGATSIKEPADQFYGDRTGGVKDASGNQWWIATHVEDVSAEELARRSAAFKP